MGCVCCTTAVCLKLAAACFALRSSCFLLLMFRQPTSLRLCCGRATQTHHLSLTLRSKTRLTMMEAKQQQGWWSCLGQQ
jgi:hypothetical protein